MQFGWFRLVHRRMVAYGWHNHDMLVVTKHRVPQEQLKDWLARARQAVAPLAACNGCESVRIGLATDEPDLVLVLSIWQSVGAYRKALSNFDVKAQSIPFLSTAVDESSAFEVVFEQIGHAITESAPARAWDADSVALGEAAGEYIAHRIEH